VVYLTIQRGSEKTDTRTTRKKENEWGYNIRRDEKRGEELRGIRKE
jgi:hypothetical protein